MKTEILRQYEWREDNILYCKDHTGEIFRFKRRFQPLTGNNTKALFTKANNSNGTVYEQQIKTIKVDREPAKVRFSKGFNEKRFRSDKPSRYEAIGYRFTPFSPKPRVTKSKIDEKPFIERFAHASYRNMLLADMKLLFHLKKEYSMELSEFLALIQESYHRNFESPSEIGQFVEIVRKLIETAKTPSGRHCFEIKVEEDTTFVYKG